MKIPESVAKKLVGKGGTFFTTSREVPAAFLDEVRRLINEALNLGPKDAERAEILKSLSRDLSHDAMSQHIREGVTAGKFRLVQQEVDWMECHPKEKWLDYLVYRYQFKMYPLKRKLRPFPVHLLIEPASACNLRCVMCFQVDATFTVKDYMGSMPWELFTRVVDQAKEADCHAVTMASRGEPTLHPQFGRMLQYVHDAGIMDSKINTNATRLTEKLCHEILCAEVNEVVFSVDAATKETYEKIRVRGIFEEVLANVERFQKIRQTHYPHSPTITRISGVLVSEEQDIDQMRNFWASRVDEVTIKKATPRWDTYNNEKVDVPHPCSLLWERMYVWYDGKVNPCDADYKSYLCVGDATKSRLGDIWLGEAYQKLRQDHLAKRRAMRVPCDRCPFY